MQITRQALPLLFGLVGIIGIAGTAEAGPALKVAEKVELTAPPAAAWAVIRDFDGWQNWHPAVGSTEITKGKGNAPGTTRVLTTKDGAKITETLVSWSDKAHSYTYRIDESPLPVTGYVSVLKVSAGKKGGSVVSWSSTFKAKDGTPDADAKKAIDGIYTAGLENLKSVVK